jgi:hypothetical protein
LSVSSVVVSAFALCFAVCSVGAQDIPSVSGPERVSAGAFSSGLEGQDVVVRKVGDIEIRASDVYRMLDLSSPAVLAEATSELVLMALVRKAAQDEGIDVPAAELEAEVNRAVSEQRARFALEVTSEISLEEFVAERHGWSSEQFRAQLRHGTFGNMLLDRVVRLNQWREARDELQIILVEDESLALEIGTKIAAGASFTVLARNHSSHPSGAEGGFMPLLPSSLTVPLVAGRQDLSVGEFLGPAPISLGGNDFWRFVRLVDRQVALTGPWPEVRRLIEDDLLETPLHGDELALFEATMAERYGVSNPLSSP